MSKTSYFICF